MPRPDATAEDDGWLLTLVFSAGTQRTELVILDAQKLSQGPLATVRLPHHIPPGMGYMSFAVFLVLSLACTSPT